MNQMAYDLQEQNFYSYFNYNKNHKFSRTELSKQLNLHNNIDSDDFDYVKKYIIDYFSLSVYIVNKINSKIKISKIFYENSHEKPIYNNLENIIQKLYCIIKIIYYPFKRKCKWIIYIFI